MTERRIGLLFRVLLFIVRGGLRNVQFPGTARERDELDRELQKEIDNIQLRCQQ